jgi:hypothetical protein
MTSVDRRTRDFSLPLFPLAKSFFLLAASSPSNAIESRDIGEERLSSCVPLYLVDPCRARRAEHAGNRPATWESSAWILTASLFDERIPRDRRIDDSSSLPSRMRKGSSRSSRCSTSTAAVAIEPDVDRAERIAEEDRPLAR